MTSNQTLTISPISHIDILIDRIFQFSGILLVHKVGYIVCKDWNRASKTAETVKVLLQRYFRLNKGQFKTSDLKDNFEVLSRGIEFIYSGAKKFNYLTKDGFYLLQNIPYMNLYLGELEDGIPQGIGICKEYSFKHGKKYNYSGEFKDSHPTGFGKQCMCYNDNITYIGDFRKGKRFGKGKLVYPCEFGQDDKPVEEYVITMEGDWYDDFLVKGCVIVIINGEEKFRYIGMYGYEPIGMGKFQLPKSPGYKCQCLSNKKNLYYRIGRYGNYMNTVFNTNDTFRDDYTFNMGYCVLQMFEEVETFAKKQEEMAAFFPNQGIQ